MDIKKRVEYLRERVKGLKEEMDDTIAAIEAEQAKQRDKPKKKIVGRVRVRG